MLQLLVYAAPALVVSALGLIFYVHLPKFYADFIGIPIGWIGAVLLITRLWDAVLDPVVGLLSDRTRSRFGRRKPWIAWSILPFALVVVLLFNPSPGSASFGVAMFAGASAIFYFFWTTIVVPYEALGADLSDDYDTRNRVFGAREGALLLGTLIGAVAPQLIAARWNVGLEEIYSILGWVMAGVLCVTLPLLLVLVPERRVRSPDNRPFSIVEIVSALRCKPFRVLLSSYAAVGFGSALPAALILLYVEHVLGSSSGALFLALYLAVGIVTVPFWAWLASRIGKIQAWFLAMASNTGPLIFVILLGYGDTNLFLVLAVLSALGVGGVISLPSSMQADVYDYDELEGGRRREGHFSGLWSLARKCSQAISTGLAFLVLGLCGYVPGSSQPPQVVAALIAMYAAVPCICNIVAMSIMRSYGLDREAYREVRARLQAKQGVMVAGRISATGAVGY